MIYIGKILKFGLSYNSIAHLKSKVSHKTCFRKGRDRRTNKTPDKKSRVLLQMQYVYYNNNKDILEDEDYYPQVFLQHCRYTFLVNNKFVHEALDFTDTEP